MPTRVWLRCPGVRLAVFLGVVFMVVATALRLTIATTLVANAPWSGRLAALLRGPLDDLLVAGVVTIPISLAWTLGADRWLRRGWIRAAVIAGFTALTVFGAFVEFFYFEEFDARFNNIAVDYVLYPHEVVGNVFESYNVPLYVTLAVASGLVAAWLARNLFAEASRPAVRLRQRFGAATVPILLAVAAVASLIGLPRDLSANREANEVAGNGLVQLVRAYWSASLDYSLYYRTLPQADAQSRAERLLGIEAADGAGPARKVFDSTRSQPPPQQVVVLLEESLGSDFVGSSGHAKTPCTSELDRWMSRGLALTNLIANGNRTVRGLEGILCSFVPLPGDSIVKRDKSENVATLARVFGSAGYSTAFFYGGFGVFDSMKPFMLANGYQEFIEQSDYPEDAFRTIWGVADEYIFDALVARQLEHRASGQPLFATLLSVSNHKPYRVPEGRPGHRAEGKPGRADAVRYADWCIGRYLDELRANGLLESTLVLIVGDHGARVYGSEEIPIRSYRIPALFVGGVAGIEGQRLERLCSQIDLAPTLLDLCGIDAQASFFGESLLGLPAQNGRAFVHHNRDVGLLLDDALVILGLRKSVTYYRRAGRESDTFEQVDEAQADAKLSALTNDAIAVFQTAHELYEGRRLGLAQATPRS